MHIKDSPVEGVKRDFAGFELDASKIELHSSHKREIHLPYVGPLPDALQDNDGAVISIVLSAGLTIGVSLVVTMDKKKLRYPVAATVQEVNDILFPFFFQDKGNNTHHTRWDNGLTQYWMGNYQSSYIHWRRFIVEEYGVDDLINQLSPKALDLLEKYIEYKKTA